MIEIKWFYAKWCGPCKIMEPIIAKIATTSDAKVTRVDVDQDSSGIGTIPTTRFYKDGRPVHEHVGVMTEGQIETKIKELQNA